MTATKQLSDMVVSRKRGIVFGRGSQLRPCSVNCPKCDGTGYIDVDSVRLECRKCFGKGTIVKIRRIDEDGQE
jgi:DnaJ-class molecular chaperone